MKKAVFLCEQVSHKDALALISWMNNKHVTGYLNEDENIVSELEYLLKHIHKAMLRYHFNRHGRFFSLYTPKIMNRLVLLNLKKKEKDIMKLSM